MTFKHLIYIPFTGVGIHQYKGDEWFKDRIEIFKNYTLKSLKYQSNRNFMIWISFRPEEASNPLILELLQAIKQEGFAHVVFTFDGLMYHDDRFLEQNISLPYRIRRTLLYLKPLSKVDYVLMTRLDSDDMLHKNAVKEIQSQELKAGALTFQRGYIYNTNTKELAEWNPDTNPPFHTIVFPAETFFDAKKHLEFYKDWTTHEDTTKVFPYTALSNFRYCVGIHNPANHISTSWSHRFRGDLVDTNILEEFGL